MELLLAQRNCRQAQSLDTMVTLPAFEPHFHHGIFPKGAGACVTGVGFSHVIFVLLSQNNITFHTIWNGKLRFRRAFIFAYVRLHSRTQQADLVLA